MNSARMGSAKACTIVLLYVFCRLIGAADAPLLAAPADWVLVAFDCPSPKDNGVLLRIEEDRHGQAAKSAVTFRRGHPFRVDAVLAKRNESYDSSTRFIVDLETESHEATKRYVMIVYVEPALRLNKEVCNAGPEAIRRFQEAVKADRDALHREERQNFNRNIPGRDFP